MASKKQSSPPIQAAIPANNGTEVLELEAVEENQLDKTITTELVKHNVTNQVIAGLKEKFGQLRLVDINDKEGYLEIKDARKEVRKWGILTENLCKKGREDAIAIQRKWLAKEKEVLGKIAEVQDPLDAEIDKYENEQERKETEAAQRREESYMKRQQTLLRMGASYENGSFVLNHISYEATLVKESDDDIWADIILPKYQREYEKNEADRVAIEKKREEEAAKMKSEREALEEQQRLFREQQESFQKQQQELRQKQEAATKIQREAKEKMWRGRLTELFNVEWNDKFVWIKGSNQNEPVTTHEAIMDYDDEAWGILRDNHNKIMVERKEKSEEQQRLKIENDIRIAKEEAAKKERERIEEEQRKAKIKEEQEIARKAEEASKASDKEKWAELLSQLNAIKIPDMKSGPYRQAVQYLNKYLSEIKGYFK